MSNTAFYILLTKQASLELGLYKKYFIDQSEYKGVI